MASNTVMAESGDVIAGVTATMSVRPSRDRTSAATAVSPSLERSTTTVSGPLLPGPNSPLTRSYARRVVSSVDWLLGSWGQVRISSAGTARVSITIAAAMAHNSGRLATLTAHRAVNGIRAGLAAPGSVVTAPRLA